MSRRIEQHAVDHTLPANIDAGVDVQIHRRRRVIVPAIGHGDGLAHLLAGAIEHDVHADFTGDLLERPHPRVLLGRERLADLLQADSDRAVAHLVLGGHIAHKCDLSAAAHHRAVQALVGNVHPCLIRINVLAPALNNSHTNGIAQLRFQFRRRVLHNGVHIGELKDEARIHAGLICRDDLLARGRAVFHQSGHLVQFLSRDLRPVLRIGDQAGNAGSGDLLHLGHVHLLLLSVHRGHKCDPVIAALEPCHIRLHGLAVPAVHDRSSEDILCPAPGGQARHAPVGLILHLVAAGCCLRALLPGLHRHARQIQRIHGMSHPALGLLLLQRLCPLFRPFRKLPRHAVRRRAAPADEASHRAFHLCDVALCPDDLARDFPCVHSLRKHALLHFAEFVDHLARDGVLHDLRDVLVEPFVRLSDQRLIQLPKAHL